jgi:hypothetical protein
MQLAVAEKVPRTLRPADVGVRVVLWAAVARCHKCWTDDVGYLLQDIEQALVDDELILAGGSLTWAPELPVRKIAGQVTHCQTP